MGLKGQERAKSHGPHHPTTVWLVRWLSLCPPRHHGGKPGSAAPPRPEPTESHRKKRKDGSAPPPLPIDREGRLPAGLAAAQRRLMTTSLSPGSAAKSARISLSTVLLTL